MSLFFAPLLVAASAATNPLAPPCGPEAGRRPWVTAADYPREAKRQKMRGETHFTLRVSEQGCPVACEVIKSSGHPLLDQTTCDLMLRRAQFQPKRDASGNPIAAEWTNKFRWAF